jgi:hypothetical protein
MGRLRGCGIVPHGGISDVFLHFFSDSSDLRRTFRLSGVRGTRMNRANPSFTAFIPSFHGSFPPSGGAARPKT